MIDSAVFNLDSDQFELRQDNKLDGRKTQQGRGFVINSEYCDEHIKKLKKQGIYCPSITKAHKTNSKTGTREVLEIQCSLPKLLYGSSLFEIDSEDLEKIYSCLLTRLDDLGIITTKEKLQKAIIRRVDFSKIIKLPERLGEANWVVEKLAKFDYKPSSDYNFHKYNDGNHGRSIKFWNTTQGLSVYDIIGNILSNGFTKTENTIIKGFRDGIVKRTALRVELSLERKDSFEAIIRNRTKGAEKKRDFYLEDIFNESLSKKILLDIFNKVFNNSALGLITLSEMEDNVLRAYLNNSKLSVKLQEKMYYWVRMATNFGISGTWEQIKLKYNGGSVATCKKQISLILAELPKIDGGLPNLIQFLRQELEKFEAIKPKRDLSTCKALSNVPQSNNSIT